MGLLKGALLHCLCAVLAVTAVAVLPAGASARGGAAQSKIMQGFKQKVGWGPLSSREARAKVTPTRWEPRPSNHDANHTVPSKEELRYFRGHQDPNNQPYLRRINGQMTGTTDDIIEWAAIKWGLPPRIMRGVAVVETWWHNDFVGDSGDSFGLFQMRRPYHCCMPVMRDSTAFNADYYGAIIRSYYDGKQTWLNNPGIAEHNGSRYAPGSFWGAIGAWYSGKWRVSESLEYIAKVREESRKRTWKTHPYFEE